MTSPRASTRLRGLIGADARRSAFRRLGYALVPALLCTGLFWFVVARLPEPDTLTIIDARTETIEFTVANARLAAFPTEGLFVNSGPADLVGRCAEGDLIPDARTKVQYLMQPRLVVVVSGTGVVRTQDRETVFNTSESPPGDASEPTDLVFVRNAEDCKDMTAVRLPVWGPGAIGGWFSPQPETGGILLSGTLHVFGRTLDLGIFGRGGALYPAYDDPIPLPAGGRMWTDEDRNASSEGTERTALFGFATVDKEGYLHAELSTDAPTLMITQPGDSVLASRIEIGTFTQALNDPNLLRLQVIIAIGFAFLPLTAAMVTLLIMEERKGDAVNGEKPHEPENREPLLAADAAEPAAAPKAQPLADDFDDAAGDA